ncbi:glycoside hydrolase family 3 C-terminal domain-containing protein [Streptomyces sp. M10(2022)]
MLPLDPAQLRSVAVIGTHATAVRIQGGGSAEVFPSRVVTPLAGIENALRGAAPVIHAPGLPASGRPRPLEGPWSRDPRTGEPGVLVRLLDGEGNELHAEHRLSGRIVEPSVRVDGATDVEIRALVRPETAGVWNWAVGGWGPLTLTVDGREVLNGTFPLDSEDPTGCMSPRPTGTRGPYSKPARRSRSWPGAGWRPGPVWRPSWLRRRLRAMPAARAAAVTAARSADVAVVVVGTSERSESEGQDRADLTLPDGQDDLVRAVVAANPARWSS